ncbi:MAG TPA: cupin domain-containing protein [Thermoleophilaceae bacterium]|nr:cupin domain-containing protein [Thermoleophilaceae bacterium]
MPNLNDPQYDEQRDKEGFRARRARIGYQLGTERLGISQWELSPGEAAYPYHLHLAEEELLIVLKGTLALRTPEGWRDLAEGEVVSFPRGEEGAHQVVNRTDSTVSFLAISTNGEPDIVLYPDSNKVGASERRPQGGGLRTFFRLDDVVDYYEGEQPPTD